MFYYLFLKESWGRGKREREERIPSRLCAISTEPDVGLELMNCEIMTWAEVRCSTDWATQVPQLLTILISSPHPMNLTIYELKIIYVIPYEQSWTHKKNIYFYGTKMTPKQSFWQDIFQSLIKFGAKRIGETIAPFFFLKKK